MASSLFDLLGNSPKAKAAPSDSGSKLQTILSTGATGKAQASDGVKASRLGERAALTTIQEQLDSVQDQAKVQQASQREQSQQITDQASFANKSVDLNHLDNRTKYNQEASQILGELSRADRSLSLDKDNAKLEQVGHLMRMSDDKYIFDLQTEGARARLDNQLAFQEQLAKSVFADETELAKTDAYWGKLLAANDIEFAEMLQQMGLDHASALAGVEQRQAATAAQWQAGTGVFSAGVDIASRYESKETPAVTDKSTGEASGQDSRNYTTRTS